jgi:diaminohydroxyphosphoribosylaminopyrimidine deaminase/5-amino-6-(5-phosphoribosylamino)uracil reductase
MSNQTPQFYMQQALALAEKGRFSVSPNPMVGCLIVKAGKIIGQGYHHQAGTPHAEIHALREAGAEAKDADVYVTLEPCCHYGRTPPCTDALIAAGVTRVYFACHDPNPEVAGKGSAALKAAGIQAEEGLCRSEAQQLNKIFFHFIQTKRPFVFSKWAMSLDGKTMTHPDDLPAISSTASRSHSHLLRRAVDAILIGTNTAIDDDPALTVRLPDVPDAQQPIPCQHT